MKKAKLQRWRTDQWLPGIRGGGRASLQCFWSNILWRDETVCISSMVMVTWSYVFVQAYRTVHQKVEKPERQHLNQTIKVNIISNGTNWSPVIPEGMQREECSITFVVFPPKMHNLRTRLEVLAGEHSYTLGGRSVLLFQGSSSSLTQSVCSFGRKHVEQWSRKGTPT